MRQCGQCRDKSEKPTQAAKEHEVCEKAPELPLLVHKSSIEVDGEGRDDLQQHLKFRCKLPSNTA